MKNQYKSGFSVINVKKLFPEQGKLATKTLLQKSREVILKYFRQYLQISLVLKIFLLELK